jgi:hypothetical protein
MCPQLMAHHPDFVAAAAQKPINLGTFFSECKAAGVTDLRFAVGEDGTINFDPNMPPDQVTLVKTVYTNHDPTKQSPLQAVQAAYANGVAIQCASDATLNGTYAIDPQTQQRIAGIVEGITARNRLPGGGTTFPYRDTSNGQHNFDQAHFINFAQAIEDYLYALENGLPTTVPLQIP